MKKKVLVGIILIALLVIGGFGISLCFPSKELTIDEILETKAYSYLSPRVKEYIKEYYEETGKVLLTKEIAKNGETYLNPSYIEYLDSDKKEEYTVIPTSVAYNPKLATSTVNYPSSYDLRSVDGKNFVTPNKDQGDEGLCWAYATASLLETHDLISKNKSYDSSAIRLSEKQLDYALSSDGILGGNKISNKSRVLSEGGMLDYPENLLLRRLTAYQDTWNTENSSVINSNGQLEPNIVFDKSKALYELNESMRLTNINSDLSNTELNEAMIDVIKGIIVNYGGATVNIKSSNSNTIRNILNGDDYLTITSLAYFTNQSNQHALHLIGWDDDYEYGFCSADDGGPYGKFVTDNALYHADHSCGTWGGGGVHHEYVKVTGRGAWLLKNSWGDSYQYIHLPYDSFIDDVFTITEYSDKNWDDNNKLEYKYNYSTSGYIYNLSNNLFEGDTIVKLKIIINGPAEIPLYYSEDGETVTLIGNYNYDYAGVKTIDLSDKNLHITQNSTFLLPNAYTAFVFTNKSNNNMNAYTNDFIYDTTSDAPTNIKYLNVSVTTNLKNVNDNETINYKIKNSSGEYLPTNAYIETINKSYNSMATPIIKLSEEYAKKGEYSLETWKDDNLLYTSLIDLKVDYESIDGNGSQNNPWQIKNIRHFNMMRNALSDNYILMNDIDFEYDTQNPNGMFYNSGKGWSAIHHFAGNFNGNNKTLKNIKTASGVFGNMNVFNDNCKFEECGIHDLKVDNLKYTVKNYGQTSGNGGIINQATILSYKYKFYNLSVTNANFIYDENVMPKFGADVNIGGIFGSLTVQQNSYYVRAIVKLDNLYSNYTLSMTGYKDYVSTSSIGGLIGKVKLYGAPYLYINNAKVNASINVNSDNDTTVYVSDLIGIYGNNAAPSFLINNAIATIDYHHNDNSGITSNAYIGGFELNAQGIVKVNGVRTTFDYTPYDNVVITNSLTGVKPYEIARSSYNGIEYYDSQYDSHNEYYDGTTKVKFEDKFNVFGNKIPTLKSSPENYSEYYRSYTLRVGETKTISDLISNDTGYHKLHLYTSFECDLDICDNVTDETIITAPTEANNYSFTGLKSGITSLIIYDELSGYLDTVTITVLNENDYVLGFDYNHDNLIGENRIITKNTEYGELPQISRTGYTFKGWFTEREDGIEIKSTDIFDGNSNITLYAHWEINKYNITFDSAGGSEVNSQEVDYNGKVTRPANPTKEGYTFKEWQLNGNLYDFDTLVTDSITLTAVYTINHYTVTFNSNGGSSIDSQEVNYNEKVTRPSNPTKKGYTFKEWQLNGNLYDFDTLVTDNITLTAVYTINQYTVTFDSNGGTSVPSQLVNHGDAITFVRPTREHYTFREWQLNGEPYSISDSVTENMTLVAIWEIHQHTVTFDSNGGSAVDSQEVNYNEIATRPTDPTRGGYQFKGWLLNGSSYNFDTPITGNITLTAVWEKLESVLAETLQNNSYTVTNNLVTGFTVGKTVQEIKTQLGNDIVIETNNSVISTGAVIKKNNESFTVVIKGDLTGDGRINSGDLLQMRKHLLEDVTLTGAYKEAGIIESNGNIKSLDLLRLRQYLLGDYTFR